MKPHAFIFLLALSLTAVIANAQTPFDSFAPETSRPMLGLDAITSKEHPSHDNGFNDSVLNTESSADDISKWLSVDPLADKYPHISPYAYCSWNPVRFVDPDGKEKINLMDGDTEDVIQCNLFEGAVNFNEYDKRDSHIFFFSHGNSTEMYPSNSEQPMSAKDFIAYISANSDVWKNTEDKSSLTIVLLSCETGKGENSLAQQISQLLPETTIIAPTELVVNSALNEESIIYGTAETYYLPDVKDHSCWGKWKTYKNGLLINTSPNGNIRYVYTEVPSNP